MYETNLPSAVAAQAAKADAMMAELAKGEIVDVIQDKPVTTPPPVVEPQPKPPEPGSNADYEALKHKHSVLEGKYNSETAELRRTIGQANTTIDRQNQMILDLHNRVRQLETGGAGSQAKEEGSRESSGNAGQLKKLDPSQFEGYGAEMGDLVSGFNTLIEENAQLKGKVAETVKSDGDLKWSQFTNGLASLVPDWEAQNFDKDFMGWLGGFDTETDIMTRQQKLDHFVGQGDFVKASKIFLAFKTSKGGVKPTPPAKPSKEDMIQPSQSASSAAAPVGSGEMKDVTAAEYNQATKDYIQKRISYEQYDKISNAFQNTLARQSQARK